MKKITWEDRYNEWEALFQYIRDNEAEILEKGRMPAMVLCLQRTWADMKKLQKGIKFNMGMKELESQILAELKEVAKDRSIRLKDIMEWSTSEIKAEEGETLYKLPNLGVWCAVKNKDNRKK